jgi:nucleoside-diphosphate-sugar epimerase
MTGKLLFLGYGYVAQRLARVVAREGWSIAATARDEDKATQLGREGVAVHLWRDGTIDARAFDADAILVSTPPDANGCPALAAMESSQQPMQDCWIGYLSSNGVYGDHGGALVDEDTPLRSASLRARHRSLAETQWANFRRSGATVVIFRLPGIYGPGRSAFDALREGRAQRIVKPGQVFSRAHVDDIARALKASLDDPAAGNLFNIADDEPAPPQDVILHAANLLGVSPPPEIRFEDAQLSEMAKSFYADNKRVSNARMKARLTPRLLYPSYREGLAAILAEERGQR